jgi:hypothetical protein
MWQSMRESIWKFATWMLDSLSEFAGMVLVVVILLGLQFAWVMLRRPGMEKALRRIASTQGMEFSYKMTLPPSLCQLPLFRLGRSIGSRHFIHGMSAGRQTLLFTYEYQMGEGEFQQWPTTRTVAAFSFDGLCIPAFTMKPRPFSSLLRLRGTGLEAHKSFSNSYVIEGDDARAIRSIFTTVVQEVFSRELGWRVEGEREWIAIYKDGRSVSHRHIAEHLRKVSELSLLFNKADLPATDRVGSTEDSRLSLDRRSFS